MARTAAQSLAFLRATLPDTPEGVIAGQLVGLWNAADGLPAATREAQVRLDALDLLLAVCCDPERVKALLTLRSTAVIQLTRARTYPAVVSVLSTRTPTLPPAGGPDANAPVYRGDPYVRGGGLR